MIKRIKLCGTDVEYDLQRKKVKNINLRIKPDGSIHVSASTRVPLERIESFLRDNESFVMNAVEKCKKRAESAPKPLGYENGEEVMLLGTKFSLEIKKNASNKAFVEKGKIVLFVKDETDTELKKKTLESFLSEICRIAVEEACEEIYPDFEEFVPEYPKIKFRKMYTKWGICRPQRNEITFSYMLAAAPRDCIEYVVYHEFCHFLHANHSKSFYAVLTKFLPDWKSKKARLGEVETLK